MAQAPATFYAAATARPGTEGFFEQSLHRLAGRRTVDGVRLSALEITGTNAVLSGEMPGGRFRHAPRPWPRTSRTSSSSGWASTSTWT